MRSICFYFQVHQPFRLKRYRFFNIGNDHNYYNDFDNRNIMRKVSSKCYLPANELLLGLIREYGANFKVAFSISGVALEQLEQYSPEALNSFRALVDTGNVELLSETYAHSLTALINKDEFTRQINLHREKIKAVFGVEPTVFRNTELIYSDDIGQTVADLGFGGMLTEGAKHILGWKSPNYVYCCATRPKLKLLLKNFKLSDDIAFRFSNHDWNEFPLTTEKFVSWLNAIDKREETVNLFMDYETFGEHQWRETGIFDFLRYLPAAVFKYSDFSFATPSETLRRLNTAGAINVPYPISWADEERDITAWLGNELQNDAFDSLYSLYDTVKNINTPEIWNDWTRLQTSDHFYYMCTKWFSDGDVHKYFNPYASPYEAYVNFMNILNDFRLKLKK